jgi:hypothetical protein
LLAGCNAHLSQPIDRDALLRTIRQFLKPSALPSLSGLQNGESLLINA